MLVYCFILYNPPEKILDRINLLLSKNFKIYIYINKLDNYILYRYIISNKNIKVFGENVNRGIGYALAEMEVSAIADGYHFMVFFDQDTIFLDCTIDCITNLPLNQIFKENYSVVQMLENSTTKLFTSNFKPLDSILTINSGSIFNLNYLSKYGLHNSSFFVDCVDYEFCLTSSINKFKCGVVDCIPGIDHTSDQGDSIFVIFGKVLKLRRYSVSRIFDYNLSMLKLIFKSIFNFKFIYTIYFIKHLTLYDIFALISLIFLKK